MDHTLTHFLSEHFPDIERPKYQTAAEKISFLLVSAMIIGTFAGALVLFFIFR